MAQGIKTEMSLEQFIIYLVLDVESMDRDMPFIQNYFKRKNLRKFVKYKPNIELVMDAKDLNGTKRFVVDGLLTHDECKLLMDIAKDFARKGDGYKGNKSPHTAMEVFEGITVGRTALLLHFGRINSRKLDLYLKSSEEAKKFLGKYFNIKEDLYFTYTHLVCRTAISGNHNNRTDYSHRIHADNCSIKKNGLCSKTSPAFTWRDYSAIIYLNNNFQGGEFFFAQDISGNTIQSNVRPKCGRMVGFSSGSENLHGVKAVTAGTRCAIGLWFTFNQKYKENDRTIAYKLIDKSASVH